jgi:polyisoprenoid-binding protein YceI
MLKTIRRLGLAALVLAVGSAARGADAYTVDPVHSSISFKISHVGISYIHGRFDDFGGTFTIDKDDAAKSSFELSIKVESVDTNNVERDKHLRNADFFNAKQFPTMTFQSTSVKAVDGGYEVSGDLTLHGVKKPVAFTLKGGGKTVEFPKGMQRVGFTTTLVIKRSDFDMKAMLDALGDEVPIDIGVEAVKQ